MQRLSIRCVRFLVRRRSTRTRSPSPTGQTLQQPLEHVEQHGSPTVPKSGTRSLGSLPQRLGGGQHEHSGLSLPTPVRSLNVNVFSVSLRTHLLRSLLVGYDRYTALHSGSLITTDKCVDTPLPTHTITAFPTDTHILQSPPTPPQRQLSHLLPLIIVPTYSPRLSIALAECT